MSEGEIMAQIQRQASGCTMKGLARQLRAGRASAAMESSETKIKSF
jgi:hypothetical protein